MQSSLKVCQQVFCVILVFLSAASLGYAQGGPQQKKKKPSKTIQIFAEGDDPTNRLIWDRKSAKPEYYRRMRATSINMDIIDKFDEIIIGDTISGYLFDDVYLQAVVTERKYVGGNPILRLNPIQEKNIDNTIFLSASGGTFFLAVDSVYRDRNYRIGYREYRKGYVVVEYQPSKLKYEENCYQGPRNIIFAIGDKVKNRESGQYVFIEDGVRGVTETAMTWRGSKRRADVAANVEGSKTVQIFAEDDDPENRIPWDESNFAFRTYVRKRKASVNPQLFADRIDEIHIGDTLVGKLFNGQYFEAVVFDRPEGARIPTLWLIMSGDDEIEDRVSLFSFKEKIYFKMQDKISGTFFLVCSREGETHHMVIEKNPSKRFHPYGEGRSLVPSEDKKDK